MTSVSKLILKGEDTVENLETKDVRIRLRIERKLRLNKQQLIYDTKD